jgi:hypothetical protein
MRIRMRVWMESRTPHFIIVMLSKIHSQWSLGQAPQLPQLPQLPPAVLHLNAALALSELAFRSEIYFPLHSS